MLKWTDKITIISEQSLWSAAKDSNKLTDGIELKLPPKFGLAQSRWIAGQFVRDEFRLNLGTNPLHHLKVIPTIFPRTVGAK